MADLEGSGAARLERRKGAAARHEIGLRAHAILKEELVNADDLKRLIMTVQQRCVDEAIKPLHANTVRHWFRQKHVMTPFLNGPPRVLIPRAWFILPMRQPISGMPPMLVMATLLPERRIVAHRLSFEGPDPQLPREVIADVIGKRCPGAERRGLIIDKSDRSACLNLLRAIFDRSESWADSAASRILFHDLCW